jgi:hypothetical protein
MAGGHPKLIPLGAARRCAGTLGHQGENLKVDYPVRGRLSTLPFVKVAIVGSSRPTNEPPLAGGDGVAVDAFSAAMAMSVA